MPPGPEQSRSSTSRTDNDGIQNGENAKVNGGGSAGGLAGTSTEPSPKQPSRLGRWWAKVGLDLPTVMMMAKGSLAPTIGLSMYQATAVAKTYTTIGYLIPIVSLLSMPILPRAKFLQNLFLNVIAVCTGAALSMLGIFCVIKARENTSGPKTPPTAYNSSASAVAAVWLFFIIWLLNSCRAARPQLQLPIIITSIFTVVAFTYAPSFPTMAYAEAFVKKLLSAFLTGFALATGVSLFVFPVTARKVVLGEITGFLKLVQQGIGAQGAYMHSLESPTMFSPVEDGHFGEAKNDNLQSTSIPSPEAAALKGSVSALAALYGKFHGDLGFGKREVAWGYLCASDLDAISEMMRNILIPMIGLSTITDIFQRAANHNGWNVDDEDDPELAEKKRSDKQKWNEIMRTLHEPYETLAVAMNEGLDHVLFTLHLQKKPKTAKADVEARGNEPKPGDPRFAAFLEEKVKTFYLQREAALKEWCTQQGVDMQADVADFKNRFVPETAEYMQHTVAQRRLYLVLYVCWRPS